MMSQLPLFHSLWIVTRTDHQVSTGGSESDVLGMACERLSKSCKLPAAVVTAGWCLTAAVWAPPFAALCLC
jgi:hypothetical protein